MASFRRLCILPLVSLAMIATLCGFSTYAPAYGLSLQAAHDVAYGDVLSLVVPDAPAVVRETQMLSRPADGHRLAYTRANQPLMDWRFASDGYRHIDPHRRVV